MGAGRGMQRKLVTAKINRRDEFYTTRDVVEAELNYYQSDFMGRTVICNCNDHPERSEFVKFFMRRMNEWQIPLLVATVYQPCVSLFDIHLQGGLLFQLVNTGKLDYSVDDFTVTQLSGDGGFESEECESLLDIPQAIVCTNAPFSRVKDLFPLLNHHGTGFLILSHMNAITYKSVFPLFLQERCWLGVSIHSGDRPFLLPNNYPHVGSRIMIDRQGRAYAHVTGVRWFTNLSSGLIDKDVYPLRDCRYDPTVYPSYDSYPAIEVSKVRDIPVDYSGLMGVPITFLDHWKPGGRFKLVGELNHGDSPPFDPAIPVLDGRVKYKRLLIQQDAKTS